MSACTSIALVLAALVSTDSRLGAPPETSDKVVIKMATAAPEGSTWMNILEKMQKSVYLRTRGRVSFKFFPGGIAGEELTVLEKIRYGQLQGAGLTGAGMGEILPAARIMELPFYFDSYEEYDHVLERLLPEFERGFEENGYVLLGWAEVGFANLFSKKPIHNVDDLRRSKVWLRTGDSMLEVALHELGIKSVPLALSDVLTSIQTGLVETVYVSPLAVIALQWFPHLDYAFDTPILNMEAGLVVDIATFAKLSEPDQTTVRRIAKEHVAELVEATRKDNEESVRILREKGVQFLEPDAGQSAEFDEIRKRIATALSGMLYEEELLERFELLVAEAKSAAAKKDGK